MKSAVFTFFILLALSSSVYLYMDNSSLRKSNADLFLTIASKDSIIQLRDDAILKITAQRDIDRVSFEKETAELINELKNKYNQKIAAYAKIVAEYKAFKDSIDTKEAIIDNKQVRTFDTWVVEQELRIRGYFQKTHPYLITFSDVSLFIHPEIIFSRSNDNPLWSATVKTNSNFLKASDIKVEIDDDLQITTNNWSYIAGVGSNFNDRVSLIGGAGYKNYTVFGNIMGSQDGVAFTIGLMKTW